MGICKPSPEFLTVFVVGLSRISGVVPTYGWIKVSLGMEVGLVPGHMVLDETQLPHKRDPAAPTFRPISVVAKRLDGSGCHGRRPWPR